VIGFDKYTGRGISAVSDHVKQSVDDIITTPIGSRVMRREYGSFIPALIDQPLNNKTILRLYAATAGAIMRWEPRLKISSIQLITDKEKSTVLVEGTINGETTTISTPVTGGI
jgi:phage baseplate assembly protein W